MPEKRGIFYGNTIMSKISKIEYGDRYVEVEIPDDKPYDPFVEYVEEKYGVTLEAYKEPHPARPTVDDIVTYRYSDNTESFNLTLSGKTVQDLWEEFVTQLLDNM